MIHVQNKKGNLNEFTAINERYQDFLKFALHRIIETALLYESQAKLSKSPDNKLFLYFLAGKKRVQHVILEMVASSNTRELNVNLHYPEQTHLNFADENYSLAESKPEYILKYAHGRAEKDLNLYTSLAALEEDIHTRKLLQTLSKMTKDFIMDVTMGYTKFSTLQIATKQRQPGQSILPHLRTKEEFPVR